MSGECGHRLPANENSQQVAEAAATTLARLNSLMRQMNDWRDQRLLLESNVRSLKIALQNEGKNPEEVLGPDPLVVHQRDEINRLQLTNDRLADEVQKVRDALLESEQAITCSGARRLKEKMTKIREEAEGERRKLKDEIGYLKLRVKEAEEDSSCSALSRLRRKLREILSNDKKMEHVVADVATRTCDTVIDLSDELKRIKDSLDESRLQNIKLNAESRRLKTALESSSNGEFPSGCSEYLETIERLGFQVKELERRIKEIEDDSNVLKRVGELEETLRETEKQLEDRETLMTSLRSELIGAKIAYNMKNNELESFKDAKCQVETLQDELTKSNERVVDLERKLNLSNTIAFQVQTLKTELVVVRTNLINSEVEREGLMNDTEKLQSILSDRNEQIAKLLAEHEERDKARRSETETARTKLSVALVENEKLKSQAGLLDASGDNANLKEKIKELEEEVFGLKCLSDPLKKDLADANAKVKTLEGEVNTLKGVQVRLEKELSGVDGRPEAALEEAEKYKKTKDVPRSHTEEWNTLSARNTELSNEVDEVKEKNLELKVEEEKLRVRVRELEEMLQEIELKIVARAEDDKRFTTSVDDVKTSEKRITRVKEKLRAESCGPSGCGEKLRTRPGRTEVTNQTSRDRLGIIEGRNDTGEREASIVKNGNTKKNANSVVAAKTLDSLQEELRNLEADNSASKSELDKLRIERDKLKVEFKKLKSANNSLNNKVKESIAKVTELTKENKELEEKLTAATNRLTGSTKKLNLVQGKLDEALKNVDTFDTMKVKFSETKLENEELKKSLDKQEKDREELTASMEKLRAKVEEQSATLQEYKEKDEKSNLDSKSKIVMDCGDYLRADRELKYYIHLQSLAVKRVVEFISYVEGTTRLKPAMATFMEPTITNVMVLNFDENVTTTFKMSQKLSEKIFSAEINVQKLESLRIEAEHLRAERDCLNKGIEKLTEMLNNLGQDVWMSCSRQSQLHTDVEPWSRVSKSNSPTHDPTAPDILETGSVKNYGDFSNVRGILGSAENSAHPLPTNEIEDPQDRRVDGINRRICALEKQIRAKQQEAAQRLIEMRETMRQERIRLMEIADRNNVPR